MPSVDESIANALADLLRLGTDLPRKRILCTSLPGMGIPEGEGNYVAYLRRELEDATLVLPLITPSFFESRVCLVELGAMWGMELPAFPIVVPPAMFAQMEEVLGRWRDIRSLAPKSVHGQASGAGGYQKDFRAAKGRYIGTAG